MSSDKPMTQPDAQAASIQVDEKIVGRIQEQLKQLLIQDFQKKFNWFKIAIGILLLLLAPAATFIGKIMLERSMSSIEARLGLQLEEMRVEVEEEILMSQMLTQSITLAVKTHLTTEDLESTMEQLKRLAVVERYKHSHNVEIVVSEISKGLMEHGHIDYLDQIEELFPWATVHSEEINARFTSYNAMRLLREINTGKPYDDDVYSDFKRHVEASRKHYAEGDILPYEVLVSFHLGGDQKSEESDTLMRSVGRLSADDQATFLWKVMQHTNPHLWERDPQVSDYRIAEVVQKFVAAYESEIHAIAFSKTEGATNPVRSALAERYSNAQGLTEEHLGRVVFTTLYNMHDDDIENLLVKSSLKSEGDFPAVP
jgi:hypothetical protein